MPCESVFIDAVTVERQRREVAELRAEGADLAKLTEHVRGEARRIRGEFRLVVEGIHGAASRR